MDLDDKIDFVRHQISMSLTFPDAPLDGQHWLVQPTLCVCTVTAPDQDTVQDCQNTH